MLVCAECIYFGLSVRLVLIVFVIAVISRRQLTKLWLLFQLLWE